MTHKKKFLSLVFLIGAFFTALITYVTYQQAQRYFIGSLTNSVNQLGSKIDAQLTRYSQLPQVLASDPRLLVPLLAAADERYPVGEQFLSVSKLLEQWNDTLNADTIYLIDRQGTTLAASNWQKRRSFVGQNYHYRPYFQQALNGQLGQYFALGASSEKRGYYFSAPVILNGQILGVLTLKVDLSLITDIWQYDGIEYVISDSAGIVFYSSEPSWLYQSLTQLDEPTKQAIIDSRQYGKAPLTALSHYRDLAQLEQSQQLQLSWPSAAGSTDFMLAKHSMAKTGWQIFGFSPTSNNHQTVLQAALMFVTIYSLLCIAIHSWWQTYRARKALASLNSKLERTVAKRTANLQDANQQLKITLSQYEHSQAELKQTQTELMQAAKLAMLGELSASINHEINQPLAAMRTYAENSRKLLEKERYQSVANNIEEIIHLNSLVSEIIARFKVFARKGSEHNSTRYTSVNHAVHSSLGLVRNRLLKEGITLRMQDIPENIHINIDAIQFEQVLVNLFQNSIHALNGINDPQIGIEVEPTSNQVNCMVWDNGAGMTDEQMAQLFDPFYTTKEEGLGLGLTISKRIIDAYKGSLIVEKHHTGGAKFTLSLPMSNKEAS
ncbi:sensor histidine kinase [Photobacterium sanctipauli]|uniref:C4-dicarboxylate transport sensor protein DctB n=1 Tax=Photobacterium sanctipauli TaxID=1342794 RepID=A0A2T3NP70_9GAMM|nr:ATP-binding protein [Photobacterium sanctipauli]PSW18051.1 sensor histidine kinase [Photobacterium sanctipauli]